MEKIRNYETNSKAKFINFYHCQNKNEEQANNKESKEETNVIVTKKRYIFFFICKQRGNQVNDYCQQSQKITRYPCKSDIIR